MVVPCCAHPPASTATSCVAMTIERMVCEEKSATYTLVPAALKQRPEGPSKKTLVPVPSAHAHDKHDDRPPANVVVVYTPPEMVVKRTARLSLSPMASIDPSAETATPCGFLSAASTPTPFVKPALPVPTTVDTFAVLMVKRRIR